MAFKNCVLTALFITCTFMACQRNSSNQPSTATTNSQNNSAAVPSIDTTATNTTIARDTTPIDPTKMYEVTQPSYKEQFSMNVVLNSDGTLGYEIRQDGKLVMLQTTIPGKKGASGFKEKRHAVEVGQLVIQKMLEGINPPDISNKELQTIMSK